VKCGNGAKMKTAKCLLLSAILVLIAIVVNGYSEASENIEFPPMKVRCVMVEEITPKFEQDGTLSLTAELSDPNAEGKVEIEWGFDGAPHGFKFKSRDENKATLTLGDQGSEVKIKACLSDGINIGGCATITLKAEVLKELLDLQKWEEIKPNEWNEPNFVCLVMDNDELQYVFYEVGSTVNTVTQEYNRDDVDLSVKVPGGILSIHRWYFGNKWHWDHKRDNLRFISGPDGTIDTIEKGNVAYMASPDDRDIYVHGIYRIFRNDKGYRWMDKSGKWKRYNREGILTAFGDRKGIIGRYLYKDENLRYVSDRNNKIVFWFDYNDDGLLSAAYDRNNRRVKYGYREGLLADVLGVLGGKTRYGYDKKGLLTSIIDAKGNETNISYDKHGKIASVLDGKGKGHIFQFDYDNKRNLYYVRIEASWGHVKGVWFNKEGEARQVNINGRTVHKIEKHGRNFIITDARGNITRKKFDKRENLLRVTYPDGSTVSYEYEEKFNKKIREIDERGIVTEYKYDKNGNMLRKVAASGSPNERVTEYTYDGNGNLLSTKNLGDEHTAEAITTMTYDAFGNMISTKGPEGNTTRFTCDIMGNVLTKKDARDNVWTYDYDYMGKLASVRNPLGNITRFSYDDVGNRVMEVDAEGRIKTYKYDDHNKLIKSTDTAGNATLFDYNADGKIIKQTDPEGKMVRFEYDADGRLSKTIDGSGNAIRMEYDDLEDTECRSCSGAGPEQPSRTIYPTFSKEYKYDVRGRKTEERDILSEKEAYTTHFSYDPSGNLISKTDKEDRTTAYEYDKLKRLVKVTDPLGNETAYTFDDRDNLLSLKDAKGNITRFEYDRNNRLLREIRPLGQETSYQYDGEGNLVEKIDAKKQKVVYTYGDAGRLTQISHFNPGDHVNPVKTVVFTYDKMGNLGTYDDGITSARYGYDNTYRKTSETVNYGAFEKTYAYTYYANGLKKTFTGPDGVAYQYSYDPNNQLTGVQIPGKGSITYTSYNWNRPVSITIPGGSKKDYVYDPLMRVKQITSKDPGQNVLMNYAYNYDKMDNIITKDTEHGNYDYGYDDLYRLTSTDNPVQIDEAFTYDAVGNRLTSANATVDWTYNQNNELAGYDGISYVYDENGNMIQKTVDSVVTSFFYNTEDRLIRVEDGSSTVIAEYYYDPFGRRLWKDVGGTKTYFLYADEGLIAELDASGQVVKTYGYKPSSTWTTDPIFMKQGDNHYFYHNDHLGTPQKLTSTNGAVVWAATYSSFGEATVDASSTIINNLRFAGQYFDGETGLHYNYHRYYDPETGRYLMVDPIGFEGGINFFIYTEANPVNAIDHLGLELRRKRIDELSPIGWGTIPRINEYKMRMRYKFLQAYKRGMEYCEKMYNKDAKEKCHPILVKAWECEDSHMLDNYEECVREMFDEFKRCVFVKSKWKQLYDNYSWGQAYWDEYWWKTSENFKRYKEKIGDTYPYK